MILYAVNKEGNRLRAILEFTNRNKEKYKCPSPFCADSLVYFRMGSKIPHFYHYRKSNCIENSEPESDAHIAMKNCFQKTLDIHEDFVESIDYYFNLSFSIHSFTYNIEELRNYLLSKSKKLSKSEPIKKIDYSILFEEGNSLLRLIFLRNVISSNAKIIDSKEFLSLFNDKDSKIRTELAINPRFVNFKEFKKFFYDKSTSVRSGVARNPKTIDFPEYKDLFSDISASVLGTLARLHETTKFEEYKMFFTHENWRIRLAVAKNPQAQKYKDFEDLLHDEDDDVREAAIKRYKN